MKTAVGFDHTATPPVICTHGVRFNDNGTVEHFTDGRHRATVEPQHIEEYAASWPTVREILAAETVSIDVLPLAPEGGTDDNEGADRSGD